MCWERSQIGRGAHWQRGRLLHAAIAHPASRLDEFQLIEQLPPEGLFGLESQGAAQFGSGLAVLSLRSQDDRQTEVSLDQTWLQSDGFAKGRHRLRALGRFSAEAKTEIEPSFAQVGLGLNGGVETGLSLLRADST